MQKKSTHPGKKKHSSPSKKSKPQKKSTKKHYGAFPGNIKDYHFNPCGLMCDEAGANFNAVEKVLGKEVLSRTVGCQWHFQACAKRHLKGINSNEQETFKLLVSQLYYTYTASEYERVSGGLHAICTWNGVGHWWNCRKFHIVPAFRGFNLSGVNLAESWHSTMQVHYKMSLAVAAWKDVPANDTDHDYIAFVTNSAKVTGRGMNLMQKIACERKTDQIFVNSALEALEW